MADVKLTAVIEAEDKASAIMAKVGKNAEGFGGKIDALQPSFKKMAAVGGIAFTAITGALAMSVKQYADAGDAIRDMSIKTGFSTEALSELKYAAELSGTSIGAVETAIKMMSKNMKGMTEDGEKSSDVLKMIGLKAGDLKGLKPEETFFKLATAVANVQDPMERSAASMKVFGKQGTDLLPLLSEGSDGINRMREEARELGIVFDQSAADAADKFNDELTALTRSFDGVKNEVAKNFLPILIQLMEAIKPHIIAIKDWVKEHPELTKWIIIVTTAVAGLTFGLGLLGIAMTLISIPMLVITGVILGFIAIIYMANEAIKIWQKDSALVIAGVKAYWQDFKNAIEKILTDIKNYFRDVLLGIKTYWKEMIDSVVSYFKPLLDALDKIWSKMQQIAGGAKSVGKKVGGGVVSGLTNFGHALGFAEGGIVTKPTLAMIGEAGESEAVIPLSKLNSVAGGRNININISGAVMTADAAKMLGDEIVNQLRFQLKF